jgi:hypothetical protein
MITDALLSFVAIGSPLSLVGADGVAIPSTNTIDLAGVGAGNAPPAIWGNTTSFGQADAMGVGGLRPELNVTVGTAATTGNSATLNVALQAAADNGSNQPGSWQTIGESGALTAAQLTANQVIFRSPWLPPFPVNLRPRFLRLLFQPAAATHFTAGTIASALVVTVRDDWFVGQQPRNYAVA